jgi:hypothetical protein
VGVAVDRLLRAPCRELLRVIQVPPVIDAPSRCVSTETK